MNLDTEELNATKNREKTADELFKELGYEKIEESNRYLRYSTDGHYGEHIDFELKTKQIRCTRVSYQLNTHFKYFTIKELQAINKKCEELGWKINI